MTSSTADIGKILAARPRIHRTAEGQSMDMSLASDVLDFIMENIPPDASTLETGCGLSTVLFASRSAHHVVITPAREEFETVLRFCAENNIETDALDFREGASELILPSLDVKPLDLVLIDGRHGFPAPFIDWFYTAGKLKIGGLMIVDDCWLWTGKVLSDLLSEQPQWEQVRDFDGRTSAFRKLDERSEWGDWTDQPYVYRNGYVKLKDGTTVVELPQPPQPATTTAMERVAGHLKRGELGVLAKKAMGRLR
ncbi:MAG: hypothetical protein QOE33_2468 [Acidobacteriota bacterium]|nr:hypothetical protein [Acidobacteriota bacterium]